MSKNWKLIRQKNAWAEAIAELMQDAKAAIPAGKAEREAVRADLRTFIDESPNWDESARIDEFDEIASKLHKQLVQADIEQQLAQMEGREPVYAEVVKEVREIARAANAAADAISLVRIRKLVDSVSDAVDALREARESIDASDEPKLARSLDDLLKAFASVRQQVDQ